MVNVRANHKVGIAMQELNVTSHPFTLLGQVAFKVSVVRILNENTK
jgi:hypothetical protein